MPSLVPLCTHLIVVGCALLFARHTPAAAGGYEVSGLFTNSVPSTNSGYFRITVDEQAWNIRTSCSPFDYVEAGSLGKGEVFFLAPHMAATQDAAARMGLAAGHGLNVADGQAMAGAVPQFVIAQHLPVIWLAYASAPYLAARTNNQLSPVHMADQHLINTGFTVPGEWSASGAPPGLPARVTFFNDGFTRGSDPQGQNRAIPNPPPYATGYVNAVFEVRDFLELGSNSLPRSFVFSVFRRKPDGKSSADLLLVRQSSFIATNARFLEKPLQAIPELPGPTAIKDYRLSGISKVTYNYTTNRWLTAAEVLGRSDRSGPEIAKRAEAPRHASSRRAVVRGVLVLLVLGPLVLAVWLRRRVKRGRRVKTYTEHL